jgi:signal transduction histidine kinase
MGNGDSAEGSANPDGQMLDALTETLLGVARATFEARAPRTYDGDSWDVLAFLVNSTADEVEVLVGELEAEREHLRLAQDQLVTAEKLAALGRLAAGVAHEMNQPLTVLRGLTGLLRADPDAKVADIEEDLVAINEAARQLSTIVDAIRSFGRVPVTTREAIDPVSPLREAARLVAKSVQDGGIEFQIDGPEDLPRVVANADQLRRVFINLLSNAIDAVAANADSGRTIVADVALADEVVVYRVADNGPGIPEENQLKIFEPFFTTKAVGVGTGLGLSIAHGIVSDHAGSIAFEPRTEGGSRFIVRIPARSFDSE